MKRSRSFTDAYDETDNVLIEAKGTGSREAIRMAIGQLADYARFVDAGVTRAVLLPQRPRPDLEELMRSQGIVAIWKSRGFDDNQPS